MDLALILGSLWQHHVVPPSGSCIMMIEHALDQDFFVRPQVVLVFPWTTHTDFERILRANDVRHFELKGLKISLMGT